MIRDFQDEIRRLKKLPRRPDLKPSGLGASGGGDTDGSSSGSSGRSKKADRKGRGPRRRNPHLHRRDVTVGLDGVPAGAVHKGYQDHTVRDIVFMARRSPTDARSGSSLMVPGMWRRCHPGWRRDASITDPASRPW